MVDDARDIGVLEIDAEREMVGAAHERALVGMVNVAHRGALPASTPAGNPVEAPPDQPSRICD